jgi:hypothetical protein
MLALAPVNAKSPTPCRVIIPSINKTIAVSFVCPTLSARGRWLTSLQAGAQPGRVGAPADGQPTGKSTDTVHFPGSLGGSSPTLFPTSFFNPALDKFRSLRRNTARDRFAVERYSTYSGFVHTAPGHRAAFSTNGLGPRYLD